MKGFCGRIAVVTGRGSGMGRELVRQLVAEGCAIAICDVSARAGVTALLRDPRSREQATGGGSPLCGRNRSWRTLCRGYVICGLNETAPR